MTAPNVPYFVPLTRRYHAVLADFKANPKTLLQHLGTARISPELCALRVAYRTGMQMPPHENGPELLAAVRSPGLVPHEVERMEAKDGDAFAQYVTIPNSEHPAAWFQYPGVADDAPVVLYLHGGGRTHNAIAAYHRIAADTSRVLSARVLLVEFPLLPDIAKAGIEQVDALLTAYQYVLQSKSSDSIVFMGESGGGGLILSTLIAIHDKHRDVPMPSCCVLISPLGDFEMGKDPECNKLDVWLHSADFQKASRCWKELMGDEQFVHPYTSPLYGEFTSDFPPTFLWYATDEAMAPDCRKMIEKLTKANVPLTSEAAACGIHAMNLFPIPETWELLSRVNAWIRTHVKANQ